MPVNTVGSISRQNLDAASLEERRVHIAGLRSSLSICIANRPTERGEPLSIWEFFQNLTGKRQDERIENIRLTSSLAPACDCQPGEGAQALRVKRPCVCPGSFATITFLTREGALKLTQNVRYHGLSHPGGVSPFARRDARGYVSLCDTCCLFGKQVRLNSEETPPLPGTREQADPGSTETRPTDLGRLEAMVVLLSGIVQGRYRRETDAMLETAMNDTNMAEAQQTIQREAKTLLTRFCGRPGTVCEALMFHYMTVIATLSPEEGVRLADKVNVTLDLTEPGSNSSFRSELMRSLETRARTALIGDIVRAVETGVRIPRNPAVDPAPREARYQPPHSSRDRRTPSQDEQETEEKLERFMRRLHDIIDANPPTSFTDTTVGLAFLTSLQKQVIKAFDAVSVTFESDNVSTAMEERHLSNFQRLTLKTDELLRLLSEEMQKTRSAEASGRHEEAERPVSARREAHGVLPEDVPTEDEIDHDIILFKRQVRNLEEMVRQAGEILFDDDIGKKKYEFLGIQEHVCPSGTAAAKELDKDIKRFSKWLKMSAPALTAGRIQDLTDCVRQGRSLHIRWSKTLCDVQRIDQTHGFGQKNSGQGIVPKAPSLKTFSYGDGKPFMNIVEWVSDLEDRVLRHYPNHTDKVLQTLNHLSPSIAAILKTHNFSRYELVKDWLFKHYLDKNKIMEAWVDQLKAVGSASKALTSANVGLYTTEVRGILKKITECSAMTADLRKRLLSQEPVAFLIQTVLKPLNRPTGKNQWNEFAVKVCQRLKDQAHLAGREVDPQELLDEMYAWLDRITKEEKVKAELADDAKLGACRSALGATAFEKKMMHQVQLLEADDNLYSDVGKVTAGVLLADSQAPTSSKL